MAAKIYAVLDTNVLVSGMFQAILRQQRVGSGLQDGLQHLASFLEGLQETIRRKSQPLLIVIPAFPVPGL